MGAFAYETCSSKFQKFLGADESLVMRTVVSWAWFRPSEKAWDKGARWYRCDVVGGGEQSEEYVAAARDRRGPARRAPGRPVDGVRRGRDGLGFAEDPLHRRRTTGGPSPRSSSATPTTSYPGDRVVEVTTRDFCSDSVGAWLNYPLDYDFGYTWFHEAEWQAGNRRSVCWAKTTE